MRELSRLLIALSQTTGVKTLIETLKPEFFDNLVSATKNISDYDPSTSTFSASSLALHMAQASNPSKSDTESSEASKISNYDTSSESDPIEPLLLTNQPFHEINHCKNNEEKSKCSPDLNKEEKSNENSEKENKDKNEKQIKLTFEKGDPIEKKESEEIPQNLNEQIEKEKYENEIETEAIVTRFGRVSKRKSRRITLHITRQVLLA
ncbi:hypothetical protein RN001_005612 [Aquatica leii]|uniref:Uncharacterized protein n=1 Tax=Aquatica leii TaxID=1421715 RepID=A0AAN7PCY0_9COLE|nr:hypothetical protein RN001_005612 [Aquatica leii]